MSNVATEVVNVKIVKAGKQSPDAFETKVVEEIVKIQNANKDIQKAINGLYILAAKEVEVSGDKNAIIIFVPYPLRKAFQKVQSRLITELEKKFEGRPVAFIAKRTILSTSYSRSKNANAIRPRSRTLTSVQEAILDDLVYPSEIVGKRTILSNEASRHQKIFLDKAHQGDVETKLDTFSCIYKKLTNKNVSFEFAQSN
ncbi:hypothetical protein WA158_004927 [Blastocystis sp. Blastoise]